MQMARMPRVYIHTGKPLKSMLHPDLVCMCMCVYFNMYAARAHLKHLFLIVHQRACFSAMNRAYYCANKKVADGAAMKLGNSMYSKPGSTVSIISLSENGLFIYQVVFSFYFSSFLSFQYIKT